MAQGPGKASLIWRFFVIFLLHLISIFFFTRGFLLTRTELATYSNCSDVSQSPCGPPPVENLTRFGNDGSSQCWTRPVVDRVVIIVLDALRFDFVAPSTFFEEARPWMDKLQVLQKLAAEEGTSARIFKAIADPPTTSLQRLKGLTTGGLPTFIDVGNSFGAPAILEDNLIHQLARNGKRVLMMGDDTWLQLFPDHFQKCYPFPSFNVKDLHTVDDGCVDHLLPSLYLDDWDVLIAHFLGVDHAGHIYGVDSSPMVEKLEQYNNILEKVVEVLKNLSGPGGSHENTLLLVMGDHGQTLNGDHGGGTTEEVETSLFAMSLKEPPPSISSVFDASSCRSSEDGREICFSTFQQLDFAATLAALVGIPFPFGSIGRVNPELYALGAGTWKGASTNASNCRSCSELEDWMHNYANVLCMNCWQVKRYIEQYSVSSAIGFPKGDLLSIEELYTNAQDNYTNNVNEELLFDSESLIGSHENISSILRQQINAYSRFLEKVADLARSKWTEFDIKEMGVGLFILLLSLVFHLFAIRGVTGRLLKSGHFKKEYTAFSIFSILMVAIRACSFLSNSYILTEGKVAIFLLATSGILIARFAFMNGKMRAEAVVFLLLNFIVGLNASHGPLKQSVTSAPANPIWALIFDVAPILVLVTLSIILCKSVSRSSYWGFLRYIIIVGTILSYVIIAANWVLESNVLSTTFVFDGVGRNYMPQMVYAIGFGLLVLLLLHKSFSKKDKICNFEEATVLATVCMLSVWSPTLVILLGRQGPLVVLVFTLGVWCITKLQNMANEMIGSRSTGVLSNNPLSVAQWSLLGVCLFFYSGHWCTFDGLRYGAAFVGFDDFNLIRQGILLAIDTFGVSHILPIFGLPFLVASQSSVYHGRQMKGAFYYKLTEVFLIYGLTTAVTTTFTIICVTIQRRHLMVWGLFAPKFVFDALGLLLTDILICVASLYYY